MSTRKSLGFFRTKIWLHRCLGMVLVLALALFGKFLVIGIRPCCYDGMVTWTTCHCKMLSKFGGGRSVNQPRSSTQHGLWLAPEDLPVGVGH